jgi:predicted TPR repeat methyltransferase
MLTRASLLVERMQENDDAVLRDEAIAAYRKARELGANAQEVDYALAAIGAEDAPPASPQHYVKELFDQYAHRFDEHLRDTLGYRTPEMLIACVLPFLGTAAGARDTVDLGCGTGLCGPLLRPLSRRLAGVDLSPKMIEQSRHRGCYDDLECAELTAYLDRHGGAFDLAMAADVLVYIGDLAALFAAAQRALRAQGLFALSVESHSGATWLLRATRRYAHSNAYLHALAASHGFTVETLQDTVLRHDHRGDIGGTLAVLRRV